MHIFSFLRLYLSPMSYFLSELSKTGTLRACQKLQKFNKTTFDNTTNIFKPKISIKIFNTLHINYIFLNKYLKNMIKE